MVQWLTKRDDIPEASDEELRHSLLTNDGRGTSFKTVVLEELLKRERNQDIIELVESLKAIVKTPRGQTTEYGAGYYVGEQLLAKRVLEVLEPSGE